jgi:peptidyl-prolyl cis-trans isomerase A (cyclophilin A)
MTFTRKIAVAITLAGAAIAASAQVPDAPGANVPTGPTAVIDTTMGRLVCGLYAEQAPKTVANFVGLAEGKKEWKDPRTGKMMRGVPLYDGTMFHRVIPGFMIQGGDPLGTGTGGPGFSFDDEATPNLKFDVPGRMAMANAGPNTNGSQFFITEQPTEFLNGKYNLFGQCDAASVALVKQIAAVPRNGSDKPNTDVKIIKVTIVPVGHKLPAMQKGEPAAGSQ